MPASLDPRAERWQPPVYTKSFAILEQRLADREWLYEDWSVVDGYLLWCWFRATGSRNGRLRPRGGVRRLARPPVRTQPSVARALDREEAEYARLQSAGSLGVTLPPHQVGRAPVPAILEPPRTEQIRSPAPSLPVI